MGGEKRKQIRLTHYDYSHPGAYFITICTAGREKLFWEADEKNCEPGGTAVGAACGRPPLSEIGVKLDREIQNLSTVYEFVCVDKYVIMPDHIHMIITISQREAGRPQAAPTISRIINQFKGAVTKAVGRPIWQKGYYDHVIRNEQDYLDIWDYIDTNPAQEREVKSFSETEGIPWQSKKTKRPM